MPHAPQSMRLPDFFALGSSKPWCYFSAKFHSLYYLIALIFSGQDLFRAKISHNNRLCGLISLSSAPNFITFEHFAKVNI
jgi:hypothetical protein